MEGGAPDPPLGGSPRRGSVAVPQVWVGARPSGSEPTGHGRWGRGCTPFLGSSWSRDPRVVGCVTPGPALTPATEDARVTSARGHGHCWEGQVLGVRLPWE